MSLNETPSNYQWPETHYVFIQAVGLFQETAPKCWQDLHALAPQLAAITKIEGGFAMYQVEPKMIYRAGFKVSQKPEHLPPGLSYEKFSGGKYTKFLLTGPYEQLPEASGRVFEIIKEKNLAVRPNAFFVENYLNDPAITKPQDLLTEILVPTT